MHIVFKKSSKKFWKDVTSSSSPQRASNTDENKGNCNRRMSNTLAGWEDYSFTYLFIYSFINHQRFICTSRHQACKNRLDIFACLKFFIIIYWINGLYRDTAPETLITWTSKVSWRNRQLNWGIDSGGNHGAELTGIGNWMAVVWDRGKMLWCYFAFSSSLYFFSSQLPSFPLRVLLLSAQLIVVSIESTSIGFVFSGQESDHMT